MEALRRRVEELELENALMREVVEARRKRPWRRPAAPVEQGEDPGDRPPEACGEVVLERTHEFLGDIKELL